MLQELDPGVRRDDDFVFLLFDSFLRDA